MGRAGDPRPVRRARAPVRVRNRLPARHGARAGARGAGHRRRPAADRAPGRGGPPAAAGPARRTDYLGEGYAIVRDPDTAVVEDALHRLVDGIRVELAEA